MDQRRSAMLLAAGVLALVLASAAYIAGQSSGHEPNSADKGLLVVVSFPNIEYDVSQLLCSGDRVYVIASSSVDPHEYQLTVDDIDHVKRADLVITLGHAAFEVKLRSLVDKDKLIEIPSIKSMRILVNPDTGSVNPHMIIYDPYNYILFVKEVAAKLASLRLNCSSYYLGKASELESEVKRLTSEAPRVHVRAVASLPYIQYAVDWLGIDVIKFLSREHGVPITPEDMEQIKQAIADGSAVLAIISVYNSKPATRADARLLEIAEEYDIPVLRVPSPYEPGTIPYKLGQIIEQVKELSNDTND